LRRALTTLPLVLLAGCALGLTAPAAAADPLDPLPGLLVPSPSPSASPSPTAAPTPSPSRAAATSSSRSVTVRPVRQTMSSAAVASPTPRPTQRLSGMTGAPLIGRTALQAPVAAPAPQLPRPVVAAAPAVFREVAPQLPRPTPRPATDHGGPGALVGGAILLLATVVGGHVLARRS